MPNRESLIKGPAKCVFNAPAGAATFFTKEDFVVNIQRETFRVGANGLAGEDRELDITLGVEMVPEGRWSSAIIAALWPHLNVVQGSGLFTNTDRTLVLHGSDTALATCQAVAVTRMPDLLFSAVNSMVGSVGFTGLRKNNAAWSDADSLFTYAPSGGTFTDTSWANSLIKTQPYTGTLATSTGFTAFETYDGFRVAFNLSTAPVPLDTQGTFQIDYQDLEMVVTCIPIGPSIANVLSELAIDGTGAQRGRSLKSLATQLTIVGKDGVTYLTAPKAQVRTGAIRFGKGVGFLRQGEIAFVCEHDFTAGVQQAICTLAAS